MCKFLRQILHKCKKIVSKSDGMKSVRKVKYIFGYRALTAAQGMRSCDNSAN